MPLFEQRQLPKSSYFAQAGQVCREVAFIESGKTAHIITTRDQPGWYYRLFFGGLSVNQLKKSILEFCGIKPVKVTYVGVIRNSTDAQRTKWLDKVRGIGRRLI